MNQPAPFNTGGRYAVLHRCGVRLEWITLGWNVVGVLVLVVAAVRASSVGRVRVEQCHRDRCQHAWCCGNGGAPVHRAAVPRRPLGPAPRSGPAATIARRLSCLSGFYDYGLREVELLEWKRSWFPPEPAALRPPDVFGVPGA